MLINLSLDIWYLNLKLNYTLYNSVHNVRELAMFVALDRKINKKTPLNNINNINNINSNIND